MVTEVGNHKYGTFSCLILAMRENAAVEIDSLIHTMIHHSFVFGWLVGGCLYQEDVKYLDSYFYLCILLVS